MNLSDADRAHIAKFVEVVGEALEDYPGAECPTSLLYGACKKAAPSKSFVPIGAFQRLLQATGYRRVSRVYGKRFVGLRPKDPALHHLVWYWPTENDDA